MHLASEVSSTTNHHQNSLESTPTMITRQQQSSKKSSKNNSSNNNNNSSSGNTSSRKENDVKTIGGMLTAESLAERTIDGLLAEHPGELVRTGSPHIVSRTRIKVILVIVLPFNYKIDNQHMTDLIFLLSSFVFILL